MNTILSWVLIAIGVIGISFFGFFLLAAVSDYWAQGCLEWPDDSLGNCSDAFGVAVNTAGVCFVAAMMVVAGIWSLRRG